MGCLATVLFAAAPIVSDVIMSTLYVRVVYYNRDGSSAASMGG